MQELELVAMELMLWQMLILKVWEESMVDVDLTSSMELKVLSQKVWQKVEGATALLVTSPEQRQDEAVKAVMTEVVSIYASIQNKLAVVIFIWKVTETTVPMTMGPMSEMTKEVPEQVQEGVQVSDWKLEQAVPAIMLAFWRTILMLQRSGTEQGMEICSCTNWLIFWQNCMAPVMGALQGSPTVSVSGQLTVAMGQSISQASRGVSVLQLRLQMEMLVAAMMKGLLIWLICTMNLRPTANCSLKMSTKMFGDTIWQERIAGAAQRAIGLVEYRLDWNALGIEPSEKVKGYCMTKMKVESEVEIACPIVTSALRVEVEPGALLLRVLRMLTPMRLVIGGLLTTEPKLELASQTSPLQLTVYISMLGDIFCMLGTTLQRCNWREQTVSASKLLCTSTATVLLVASSGLSLSTCAVVMVRAKVGAARLVQAMAMEELTRMQLQGSRLVLYQSMVTSRQELLGSAFSMVKGRMQIDGEFQVSGQRPMLPAGARASAEATSRASKKGNATLGINIMIYIQLTITPMGKSRQTSQFVESPVSETKAQLQKADWRVEAGCSRKRRRERLILANTVDIKQAPRCFLKRQLQTPSFPDEVDVEERGDEGQPGREAEVKGEFPGAEVVVTGEGVQQVLADHHLVLLPALLIPAVPVLVDVVTQPAQALQEVDVCYVLPEPLQQVRPGADLQLHHERQQVVEIAEEDHRLEEYHEPVHLAEPPLLAHADKILKNHQQPVAAQEPPQLPDLRTQLLQGFQIGDKAVGPSKFQKGGEESEDLSCEWVTLSEVNVPSLMRPQMAWWRRSCSLAIGKVSRKVRGSSPKKVSAWVVIQSFSSGIGFSICSC